MSLQKDLQELINAEVISTDTAQDIQAYYQQRKDNTGNRLFMVFGVLGAILIGLGIILILAHNWDNLSKNIKLLIAFLPLVLGQGLCAFTLFKKSDSSTWRESSATFLLFAVGASIALVSQIYNLSGSLSSFLLTWILLTLPLTYIMRSSMVALLGLAGITWYTTIIGYDENFRDSGYWHFLLLVGVLLPHYYLLYKKEPQSNALIFYHWGIPIAFMITLGTIATRSADDLMWVAYISLFGLFYLISNLSYFKKQAIFRNGYKIIGALGTVITLLILSFDWVWEDLSRKAFKAATFFSSPDFVAALVISLLALVLLIRQLKHQSLKSIQPIDFVFLLFIILFVLSFVFPLTVVLINFLLLGIGVLTIRKGAIENHLGILNYGLLIITALVLCRFFDTDLSFVWRGLLFVAVGIGFFITNYQMLQKRKANGL